MKDWKKFIMSLSEMKDDSSLNPIMAYPWGCKLSWESKHKCKKGYVCHCDDGYLCEHRAKWLIKFIEKEILTHKPI